MQRTLTASLLIFLCYFTSWSQEPLRKNLKGKITSDYSNLEGIYVINLSTEKSIVTEKGGYFSISAKANDTLMFSGVQFKGRNIVLKKEDFNEDLLLVRLEAQITFLDEVYVRKYNNINAVSLGIVPKGQKSYTKAERNLKSGTESGTKLGFDAATLQPMIGLSLDPLFNMFSGRSKILKKEYEVEKKEGTLKFIEDLYEDEFYVNDLKIPQDHIRGFQYYLIENERLVRAVKTKNKTMIKFVIGELAVEYNSKRWDEKK
ncbi:hypothetical protein [Flavobacterium sp. '19STA2R22 D10 B1']|uniref:hypothetical protein n=1 Tax=Flavobacterium aerium TaxID=3037261 RepID=UPI00278BCAFD|nr:hypothetical protein [Flavobacterium sp. '19STA2R22 D10 B1']